VIDELPDVLFAKLCDGDKLTFCALPEPETEPPDEKTSEFQIELEAARLTDEEYREATTRLDPDDVSSSEAAKIERDLRDHVRKKLGLPPWTDESTLSRSDFARQRGLEPTYELPFPRDAGDDPEKHLDDQIQTLLFPREMDRKLGGIYDQARTMLQEAGIDTLRAAFGFLEWYESETSERALLAPLLLMPVEMERKRSRPWRKYLLHSEGSKIEANKTLAIRMGREFGFDLPEFGEDDTPERYLGKVAEAIEPHRRWQVRRFLTVGNFGFSKLAMYNDLKPDAWPSKHSILDHTLVRELLLGSPNSGESIFSAEDYEIDSQGMDRRTPCLILDADASQHSAILDALEGKNLVIKGPPGTGKSQTIANLIAAGLASGKRILFVAEKMAALDVVHDRLKDVDLDDFCLELHSNKVPKTAVIESLRQRLELPDDVPLPRDIEAKQEELRNRRDEINEYVTEINKPIGALEMTVQEVLWASQRAKMDAGDAFEAVKKIPMPNALDLTRVKMNSAKHVINVAFETRDSISSKFGSSSGHPWGWVGNANMNPFEVEETREATELWHRRLKEVKQALGEIQTQCGVPETEIGTLPRIEALVRCIDALPTIPDQSQCWIASALQESKVSAAARQFVDFVKPSSTHSNEESHSDQIENLPPLDRDWAETAEQLTVAINIVLDCSPEPPTLQAAARFFRTKEKTLTDFTGLLEFAHSLQRACGISETLEISVLKNALKALDLLRSVSREVLLHRSPEIVNEASRPILAEAGEKAQESWLHRSELDELFVLHPLPLLEDVNQHAAALRGAGKITFFSSDVGKAKKFYRSISLKKARANISRMASELTGLAKYLATIRGIAEDESLKEICGPWFRGPNTKFDLLIETQDWCCRVQEEFHITSEAVPSVRRLLLEGKIEVLEGLVASIPNDLATGEIQRILEKKVSPSNIGQWVETERDALQTLGSAISNLDRAGIRRQSNLREVRQAAEALGGLETFQEILQSTRNHYLSGSGDCLSGEITTANIRSALDYVTRISGSGAPAPIISRLCSPSAATFRESLQGWAQRHREKIGFEQSSRKTVIGLTSMSALKFCACADVSEGDINKIIERLEFAIRHKDVLSQWTDFLRSINSADQYGLSEFIENLIETPATAHTATAAYERLVYDALARTAYERYPRLTDFNGLSLERVRSRFQELDGEMLRLQRQHLRAKLISKAIPAGIGHGLKRDYTEISLIQHELGKRKHIPIRDLVCRAGKAIGQMKPCFMMSPLSIATFLPPGEFSFDLVVIDEASQMTPADAIGVLARADQCVIVGDPQQLPPTSFFKRFEDLGEEDEADEEETIDAESILDQAFGVFRPPRELRWHYRSRHESLIAFSNKHFYENRLTLFPSPFEKDEHYGVRLVNVDGHYADRNNPAEAQAIAEWAVEFMRNRPKKSLGLVAVNQLQRDLIYDEMERWFGQDGAAEDYRSRWENTLAPFFVKNLENVQGDERDVIAISTVYGPNADGRVMQNFGPISQRNGHRRLNVLFTRAREQVVLFSSLRPEDIQIRETTGRGPRILKNYLDYALTGRLDPGRTTRRAPDSDFEVAVANRLEALGYEVVPQVGVAGFYIDLAIRHPDFPGIFLLGVECDGATYHSAKSARDRDRLREEVLKGLNWKLYRIWSTDWFRNPERETERLRIYIEQLAEERRTLLRPLTEPARLEIEKEAAEDRDFKEHGPEVLPEAYREAEPEITTASSPDREIMEEAKEPAEEDIVEIGDTVVFRYLDMPDEPRTFTIVNGDYDPDQGTISPYTAVGAALLDSIIGEEVDVAGPKGPRTIIIDKIHKARPKPPFPISPALTISVAAENEGSAREEDVIIFPEGTFSEGNRFQPATKSNMEMVGYRSWQPRPLPDPRDGGRIQVANCLKEIIETEGPMQVMRAFRLYTRACGIHRVGREVRSRLNGALHNLILAGEVEVEMEGPKGGQINGVVRMKDAPKVLARTGGDREFWDIPPSEIAEVMKRKRSADSSVSDEDLYRNVLAHYGISRLTINIRTEFTRIHRTFLRGEY
jgi:transcription elongation GreA/GreB family factor/DNA polymerase III delta prime subunit